MIKAAIKLEGKNFSTLPIWTTTLHFLTELPLQWGRFPKEKSLKSKTVLFCNYKREDLFNIYLGAQDLKFMKLPI